MFGRKSSSKTKSDIEKAGLSPKSSRAVQDSSGGSKSPKSPKKELYTRPKRLSSSESDLSSSGADLDSKEKLSSPKAESESESSEDVPKTRSGLFSSKGGVSSSPAPSHKSSRSATPQPSRSDKKSYSAFKDSGELLGAGQGELFDEGSSEPAGAGSDGELESTSSYSSEPKKEAKKAFKPVKVEAKKEDSKKEKKKVDEKMFSQSDKKKKLQKMDAPKKEEPKKEKEKKDDGKEKKQLLKALKRVEPKKEEKKEEKKKVDKKEEPKKESKKEERKPFWDEKPKEEKKEDTKTGLLEEMDDAETGQGSISKRLQALQNPAGAGSSSPASPSKVRHSESSPSSSDGEQDDDKWASSYSTDPAWITETGIPQFTFDNFTRYFSKGNNRTDNANRAKMMGFPDGVRIAPGANIRVPDPLTAIGKDVHIGSFAYINGSVTIGDEVTIGPHCSITSNTHLFNPSAQNFKGNNRDNPITIKRGCWIASTVTITGGTTIGECVLVCAGAVVTRDVPDYSIVAGVPARVVGYTDPATGQKTWTTSPEV
jgi:acetyltransferase-like isoleucine patch superfamily enzyme